MKEFYFDMPCGVTIIIKAESLAEAIKIDSKYDLSSRFTHVDATENEPLQVLLPEMPSIDEDCLTMVSDLEEPFETFSKDDQPEKFQAIVEDYRKASDPLKDLCDQLKERGMGFVFWTCPKGCQGQVAWDHSQKPSVATCEVCGQTSKQ